MAPKRMSADGESLYLTERPSAAATDAGKQELPNLSGELRLVLGSTCCIYAPVNRAGRAMRRRE